LGLRRLEGKKENHWRPTAKEAWTSRLNGLVKTSKNPAERPRHFEFSERVQWRNSEFVTTKKAYGVIQLKKLKKGGEELGAASDKEMSEEAEQGYSRKMTG